MQAEAAELLAAVQSEEEALQLLRMQVPLPFPERIDKFPGSRRPGGKHGDYVLQC